jgi:NADPH:quinone reductase-like Zn-dependent oxidoreductase
MLQKVVRSTVIDAPIERVWAVIRDFNSHDQWHDVVEISRIEGGEASSQVGCVRSFSLRDGNRIREQLLTLDDREHKSTYCIVEATVPLQRYVATVTLKPITDGDRTFWHWESTFATPPGQERELREMVARDVYEAGFANLRRHLERGADLRAPGAAPLPSALPLPARRIAVHTPGDATQLRPEDATVAAPAPGEVRIRQRAIGVNFIDVYLRRGWIPALMGPGGTPGMEAAGSVLDVGDGVTGLLPGDRVAYLGPAPGAYASVRNVPAAWVVRLPPAIEDDIAAAWLLKGLTADYLLRDLGHVRAGTRVLVHAAAGGVGLMVSAMARRLGATLIGTVSSEAKARVAREFGCEHVIVTEDYRFADAVQRLCGGANLIIDGLGRAARDENLAALARRGHWVSLGQASGPLDAIAPDLLLHKSATLSRPVVFDYIDTREALVERTERLWQQLSARDWKAPPIERFALDAAADAHARLESRRSVGALVLMA